MNVLIQIPGEPQGKGRPRVGRVAGHARMFTPAKTAAYEGLVAMAAQDAMQGAEPTDRPCAVDLQIVCTVPASWSRVKRESALAGAIRPTKKPDIDNCMKAVFDGMNGVVWRDDVQAVEVSARKRYGATPGVFVHVKEVA